MTKIAVIGAGPMGSALFKAIASSQAGDEVVLCDRNASKLEGVQQGHTTTDATAAVQGADVVVVAVKPHALEALVKQAGTTLADTLVISVLAGVPRDALVKITGAARVIRSMPNLPVQVGEGITGWIATDAVTEADKALAIRLFEAQGASVELSDESQVDTLTAIAGCGPAYFFHLAEVLTEKAQQYGFDEPAARLLAEKTLVGAGKLLAENSLSAGEWAKGVASKGGCTEAALNILGNGTYSTTVSDAVDAAYHKAQELAR